MAKGKPSSIRDNFGRYQKYLTLNITKRLETIAEETSTDISEKIAEKLEKCYKDNVEQSYGPRSIGTALNAPENPDSKPYEHTGKFLESIHAVIEKDKGIGRNRVRIEIDELTYPDGRKTTVDIHEYLTEGTKGDGKITGYYSFDNGNTRPSTYNYPTPKHDFEEHTMLQMLGFLETLDIKNKKTRR